MSVGRSCFGKRVAGWKSSFNYKGSEYYEKTVRVEDFSQDCSIWSYIYNDSDYYYSKGDIQSPVNFCVPYYIPPERMTKPYDGPHPVDEIGLASATGSYLVVNGEILIMFASKKPFGFGPDITPSGSALLRQSDYFQSFFREPVKCSLKRIKNTEDIP